MAPPVLDRVVTRCLAKDPDARWQTALDLHEELRWITEEAAAVFGADGPMPGARKKRELLLVGAAVILAALAAWGVLRPSLNPSLDSRWAFLPGQELTHFGAISPDGKRVAYTAREGTAAQRLYVRSVESFDAITLPGSDGAIAPFFSPDGDSVGFFAEAKLKRAAVAGGAAFEIADAPNALGGSWGEDGTIVFVPERAEVRSSS